MKENNYHNKLTNIASLMTKSAIVYILLILFAIIFAALLVTTAKADIQITDPQPGNRQTDFDIIVSINNSLNVSDTQAMIAGFDWMPMTQITQNGKISEWTTRAKISDYPAGTATITARYREQGKAWIFVTKTRTININKTDPATIKASVTFTVLDYFNNPIADVMVQPTGNKTDTTGIVTVAGLSLSQTLFTFTKNGYNTTSINMTLMGSSQSQTVILRKDGDTLKSFSVSGLSTVVSKDTVSYIKVKDATTKEYVSGATVTTFIGSQVKSMPGETTGGRITVGFNEPGDFDLLIEKDGYKDYSETIKVIAPTVTPTPVPPVILPPPPPIPEKKFRADVGANITDDEYRIWLTVQEQKAAQQNANNTSNQSSTSPPVSSPPSSPPYTTYALLGIVGLVSVTTYISKKKKNGQQSQDDTASTESTDYRLTEESAPKPPETITLTCTQCPWTKEVPREFESSIESVQANHAKLHEV